MRSRTFSAGLSLPLAWTIATLPALSDGSLWARTKKPVIKEHYWGKNLMIGVVEQLGEHDVENVLDQLAQNSSLKLTQKMSRAAKECVCEERLDLVSAMLRLAAEAVEHAQGKGIVLCDIKTESECCHALLLAFSAFPQFLFTDATCLLC